MHVKTMNGLFLYVETVTPCPRPPFCMFRLWMPFSCMLTVLVCSDSQRLFLVCSDCESLLFVYLNCECLFCVCMCRLWTPFLVCSDCQRLFLACPDCECLFSFLFRLWLPFSCMFRLWTPFSCIFRLWTPFPCMVRLWTPFTCIRIQTVPDAYPRTLNPFFFFLVCSDCQRLFLVCSDCKYLSVVCSDCKCLFSLDYEMPGNEMISAISQRRLAVKSLRHSVYSCDA